MASNSRRVHVCGMCGHELVCVAAIEPVAGDDVIRCPCDFNNCEWVELDPALAHAVLATLAIEQRGRC